jgi:hypothetical protein
MRACRGLAALLASSLEKNESAPIELATPPTMRRFESVEWDIMKPLYGRS